MSEGITKVCGYKDYRGEFHETLEEAEMANLQNSIEYGVRLEYESKWGKHMTSPPSSKDTTAYILDRYTLVPKVCPICKRSRTVEPRESVDIGSTNDRFPCYYCKPEQYKKLQR